MLEETDNFTVYSAYEKVIFKVKKLWKEVDLQKEYLAYAQCGNY